MMQSLDGRIDCDMVDKISGKEYYYALDELACPSHIEGKRTCLLHSCGKKTFQIQAPVPIGKESYFIAKNLKGYDISLDNSGELLWENTDNKRRLCIASERASRQYLDYLRTKGISYITAGSPLINLRRAMAILADKFSVSRVALVGGGTINGAFLAAGLIDELSVMIAPGIDGRSGQTALFDGIPESCQPLPLRFASVKLLASNVLWTRYLIENKNHYLQGAGFLPALTHEEETGGDSNSQGA